MESSSRKKARVGLENASLTGVGQTTLSFSRSFGSHDVRLIELPADVLKGIEEGQTLKIIGPSGDGKSSSSSSSGSGSSGSKSGPTDAVLCTSSKTYTIKKVETSNSVFVIPPSDDGGCDFKIHSLSQFYYELKSAPPRTERVSELLRRAEYHGVASEEAEADAAETDPSAPLLTYSELRAEVQASDEEFAASLFALGVVELRGKMRLLSKTAVREVTRDLIDTLMERGWPIDRVDHQECLVAMPGTDPVLLEFALKTLGTPDSNNSSSSSSSSGSSLWSLSREAVCQATAHILFNAQAVPSAPWDCDDFRGAWEARTPGAAPDEALLLRGIALKVDGKKTVGAAKGGSDSCYVYLPVDGMAGCDLPGRLHQLFQVSPQLQLVQLEPYFLDLVGGAGKPKTVAELLIMSGKVSNVDGYFVSR